MLYNNNVSAVIQTYRSPASSTSYRMKGMNLKMSLFYVIESITYFWEVGGSCTTYLSAQVLKLHSCTQMTGHWFHSARELGKSDKLTNCCQCALE